MNSIRRVVALLGIINPHLGAYSTPLERTPDPDPTKPPAPQPSRVDETPPRDPRSVIVSRDTRRDVATFAPATRDASAFSTVDPFGPSRAPAPTTPRLAVTPRAPKISKFERRIQRNARRNARWTNRR